MEKPEIIKDTKLFTDSDLDGKSCAVLAKLYHGKYVDITYSNPVGINDILTEFINNKEYELYKTIYITDLNIKPDIAGLISTVHSPDHQFIFIDHHETSMFMNELYDWATVAVEQFGYKTCATRLLYMYLASKHGTFTNDSGQVAYYVGLVRLWDTWDWKNADPEIAKMVKDLNLLCNTYNTNRFVSTTYIKLKDNRPLFSHAENEIISLLTNNATRYCLKKMKSVKKIRYNDLLLGVVFAENNISELGNMICTENPDIDIAFMICPDINIVSMRTIKDNVNLAEFAKKFGGGGHVKSAGFPYSRFSNRKLIDSILYDKD